MRRTLIGLLALLMLISVPFTAEAATNLSTEQKYEVLKQKNIFTGFADGSSRLFDPMTREQMATILFRLFELPVITSSPSYNDVLKTRWSFQEIESVTRAKLMGGTKSKIFSPLLNVTVEQLAAVFVRSYGQSGGGSTPVTGKVSKWARGAVSQALDRKLIPQLSDYTVDATRGLLVEAAYAVYEDTHVEPIRIRSVDVLSSQSIRVNLVQRIDQIDKNRFSIKDMHGNNRNIQQATLNQDGMSILLWTDKQSGGIVHTLYVDDITWGYVSAQEDTTKPTVTQLSRLANRSYEVTFSEPVEAGSATKFDNYLFNNGLKLATLQLSSDPRKVIFTTKDQSDSKTYQLTIRNVKDPAGNVMDTRSDLYLYSNNDNTKPKINSVQVNANATITVKFNEKVKPEYANQTERYKIDNGLAVVQAVLNGDGQTVTLKTSPQKDRTLYKLTVSNIPDLAGNVMDVSSNWAFGGVAIPEVTVQLAYITVIDQSTAEIAFNRTLTGSDVTNMKLTILTDNGTNLPTNEWVAYVRPKAGNDKAYTVQFRAKDNKQKLFLAGHVYLGKVTGVTGMDSAGEQREFAGTHVENPAPYVTQVIATGNKSVKVIFSEPVTNVNETAFRIRDRDGNNVNIDYDELNDTGKIVNEVVLRLRDELRSNQSYEMTFVPNIITDAPKWNGLKTSDGSNPFIVYFNGI